MTPTGYQKVLADLRHHKEVLRPQNVLALEEARAHGDISENAEYESAKDRQGHIEGRIIELEAKVGLAEVIDVNTMRESDLVVFGVTVELEDQDSGESLRYRIVGTEEVDVRAGLISYTSPIGTALLGMRVGDEVKFETPAGTRSVAIAAVRYRH